MRLDLFCLVFIGYFILVSDAAGKDKDVHIKIHVPELIHKHSHQHTIYKKTPKSHDESEYNEPNGHIVIHSHNYSPDDGYVHKENYAHKPEKKYKPKQKKVDKKKSKKQKKKKYGDDKDFKEILENYDKKPEKNDEFNSNDGGYKTSVHTEHYEVKKINPNAKFPDEKYIIQGAYKVQETDPWGFPSTSYHEYDSPVSKIAASILSKYDYTNFRPGESDEFDKEKEDNNHENIEYDSNVDSFGSYEKKKKSGDGKSNQNNNHDYYSPNYNGYDTGSKTTQDYSYDKPQVKNNGKNYQKSAVFPHEKNSQYTAPLNYGPVQPSHEDLHSKQGYVDKNQKNQAYKAPGIYGNFNADDSNRKENVKEGPSEIEYIAPHDHGSVQRDIEYEFAKEFGHLSYPSEPHYDYNSEWEKHLIDHIYGNNHAASNKFEQRVRPRRG